MADEAVAGRVDDEARDDLVLCVSELVTNAVRHGASAPVVSLTIGVDHVRLEVSDQSEELPEVRPVDPDRDGGNGCRLVWTLAQSAGVRFDDQGSKVVWCVIATST